MVSLGLGWAHSSGSLGYMTGGMVLPTSNISPVTGDISTGSQYVPGYWVEGDPMRTTSGHRSDVRVVLVPAAGVLALAANRRSETMRRAGRAAVMALAVIGLLALGRGMQAAAISMALAVVLAAPVVWPSARLGPFTRVTV
ncbi:MAG: hypothetical protein ACXIVQ_09550 [Acidimicrobiales bacterium]